MYTKNRLIGLLEYHKVPIVDMTDPPTREDRVKVAMAIRKLDPYQAAELAIGRRVDASEATLPMMIHFDKSEIRFDSESVAYNFLSGFADESKKTVSRTSPPQQGKGRPSPCCIGEFSIF